MAEQLQIVRSKGRKALISVWGTATLYPDGRAEMGLPPNRPDLQSLEAALKQPLELRYLPVGSPLS